MSPKMYRSQKKKKSDPPSEFEDWGGGGDGCCWGGLSPIDSVATSPSLIPPICAMAPLSFLPPICDANYHYHTQICIEARGERRFNPASKKGVFFQHFQARRQKIDSQDKFRRSKKKSRVPSISRRSKKKKVFPSQKKKRKQLWPTDYVGRSNRTTPDGCISFLPSAHLLLPFLTKNLLLSVDRLFSFFSPYF